MNLGAEQRTIVGLEQFHSNSKLLNDAGRCGLLSNQASIDSRYNPAWKILADHLGKRLTCLFGPQHGFAGTAQDNMIETSHQRHIHTNLPLYSLYSETRQPTEEMLQHVDTLIIDLQIVGCRIYTWKSTIAACLRAAKQFNKKVVILDRPNPLGGLQVEGRVLEEDAHSFVGEFPIPMRHGLTAGEAGLFFNTFIQAELEVIKLENWNPAHYWFENGRPWVLTSPNLPTPDPVYIYPGTVIMEGTNLSEGRGTGLPFQFIGAPYIKNAQHYIARVHELLGQRLQGVYLREAAFEPVAQKWQGKACQGVQIHILDPHSIRSYSLALALVRAAMELGGDKFEWKQPPYEYDYSTLPFKLIIGSLKVLDHMGSNFSCDDSFWSGGIKEYLKEVQPCLLYPRKMSDVT